MKQYESASLNMRTYMQTSGRLSKQRINDSVYISFDYIFFFCRLISSLMQAYIFTKNKLKLYTNPLKHMSTKLLTFIYFSPPRFLHIRFSVCAVLFLLSFRFTYFFSAFWLFFCLTFTRNTEQSQYSVVSRIFYARYFLPNQHEHTRGGSEVARGRKREHSTIYRQNAKIKSIKQILAVRIVCVCVYVAVFWNYHGRLLPISEWNHVSFPLYQLSQPSTIRPLDFNRLCLNSFQWAQILYTWSLHLPSIHFERGHFFHI